MLLEPEDHAPQARCYRCGSPDIFSVCHHCGKGMCSKHSPQTVDAAERPLSKEFSGLGLDGPQAGVYHCRGHAHAMKGGLIPLILVGAAVAVIGVFVMIATLVVGLLLMLAGAGVALGAYRVHRRRSAAELEVRPPLPVLPSLDSVSVRETLRGQVRLAEDGAYTSTPKPPEGVVEVAMTLAKSDRERLGMYQAKYGLDDGEAEFSAGFALLKGEVGLTLRPEDQQRHLLLPGGTGLSFRGRVSGHPLFSTDRGRAAGQWTVRIPYGLHRAREPKGIPIWIVPSLVPGSDKRTVMLDLHWAAFGAERSGEARKYLKFLRFELIHLDVPKAWGNLETVQPGGALTGEGESPHLRTIEWKPLSPSGQEKTGSQTLAIRFEKQIKSTDKITGTLRASFKSTLSGVSDIQMFRPAGGAWLQPAKTIIAMEALVDFELSLNAVRYQAVRVVPDGAMDPYRRESDEFDGVIPDDQTVTDLTNELSDSGYYVKRVLEHQPRGGRRANVVNRVWDVTGRRYDGVFPIDFHITLTGEEEYRGGIQANAGSTAARLIVRGSHVNQDMETQVVNEWETLHDMVTTKLEARRSRAAMPDNGTQPMGAQPYPSATEWSTAPPPSSSHPGAAPGASGMGREAELRKRLDDATDALLAGRISEETYRRIESAIRDELGGGLNSPEGGAYRP